MKNTWWKFGEAHREHTNENNDLLLVGASDATMKPRKHGERITLCSRGVSRTKHIRPSRCKSRDTGSKLALPRREPNELASFAYPARTPPDNETTLFRGLRSFFSSESFIYIFYFSSFAPFSFASVDSKGTGKERKKWTMEGS